MPARKAARFEQPPECPSAVSVKGFNVAVVVPSVNAPVVMSPCSTPWGGKEAMSSCLPPEKETVRVPVRRQFPSWQRLVAGHLLT